MIYDSLRKAGQESRWGRGQEQKNTGDLDLERKKREENKMDLIS